MLNEETTLNIFFDEGGVKKEPYFCTSGKLTWLAGRNIEDRPLTKEEISILKKFGISEGGRVIFFNDLNTIYFPALQKYLSINIEHEAYIIALNMMYNMGETRFNPKKWPKFFRAVNNNDYREAAKQLKHKSDGVTLNSYFVKTKTRSERLYKSLLRIADPLEEEEEKK